MFKAWPVYFLWFVSLSSMAAEVSQADMAAAQRMTQQAVQDASKAYEQLSRQSTVDSKAQSINLSELPKANADLGKLQHWLHQAQAAQMLSSSASNKVQGLLFVSFSMPETSLKSYLKQAAEINGGRSIKLVIRGLDESNSLIKTQQRLARLMTGVSAQVDIDPGAFERFNIQQVPALVFFEDDSFTQAMCALKGDTKSLVANVDKVAMVQGEVNFATAIDHLLRTNSNAKQWHKELTAMRDAVVGKF